MTEFDLIAGIRPPEPLPDERELAAARSRLMRTLALEPGTAAARGNPPAWRRALPGRRSAAPRRRRGIVLGAVLAAGLAAACVVALTVNAGSDGGPAVTRGPVPHIPATLTAAQFLTEAAATTRGEQAPVPAPDQYIYSVEYSNSPGQGTSREWLAADGSRPGVVELSNGIREPVSVCTVAQAASTGCNPSAGYLAGLPVSANAVLSYLVQLQLAATGTNPQSTPNWLANNNGKAVEALLQTTYLLPAQQAAVIQMLAQTPGFEIVRDAADARGRRGVGIYWLYQGSGAMMVFDPVTYRFLGFGTWPDGAVPANGQVPPASGGVVSAPNGVALLTMAIVNSEPPVPPSPTGRKAAQESATTRKMLSLFAQARSWGAAQPGHQQLTFGEITEAYLREVLHESPAQVQQDMSQLAKILRAAGILCVPDNPQALTGPRKGEAHPWPCNAG
jgi:hypothetical protein